MTLAMTGYQTVKYLYVTAQKVKEVSGGGSKGYFSCDTEWNDPDPNGTLTLKFTLIIYINNELNDKLKAEIKTHETRHFTDCKGLAIKLKADLEKAMKAKRDPQINDRMAWFHYDRCQKAAAFHRSDAGGGYSVDMCSQPSSPRPT